jgi:isocitrate dehydrogenase
MFSLKLQSSRHHRLLSLPSIKNTNGLLLLPINYIPIHLFSTHHHNNHHHHHHHVEPTNNSSKKMWSLDGKILRASPMVYISGEEMTGYAMELIMNRWIKPNVDISRWEFFDLSVKNRDKTDDKILHDAVEAGKKLKSIFKEPTVTPSEAQKEAWGLKKAWGSPNGAMRRGWNGITISRDTIHIEGIPLGFKHPVLFDRHAVGGEYSAGWKSVGKGTLETIFKPMNSNEPSLLVDRRVLTNNSSVVVTYDNPLDNVTDLAHHFFSRCLQMHVTPYVVTKKTVFKWQEGFWIRMKKVYDEHYKEKFINAGILGANTKAPGELQHLISDSATMQIIRWNDGGFGFASHNYDGDVLSDEIAQVHRSPGFMTSNLCGKDNDGNPIREFEASHGTVTDMWSAHLRGKETSLNPLGLVEALLGAMKFATENDKSGQADFRILEFIDDVRSTIHKAFVSGNGTRDICGPEGLTTEAFVDIVGSVLDRSVPRTTLNVPPALRVTKPALTQKRKFTEEDNTLIRKLFKELDEDNNGLLDLEEFTQAIIRLGVQPKSFVFGVEMPKRERPK